MDIKPPEENQAQSAPKIPLNVSAKSIQMPTNKTIPENNKLSRKAMPSKAKIESVVKQLREL